MLIDHMIKSWLRAITLKEYGFCDGAELFVLLSGVSAGIVYHRVMVRDGLVTQVSVFMSNGTRPSLSLSQKMPLPAGCASSPCVKPMIPPTKVLAGIMVVFNNESEFRNRMPQAIQTACLSRIHGCSTYDELAPLTRGLNLDAIAALK